MIALAVHERRVLVLGRVADEQIWMLVAYVQSMSGRLPMDVLPSRADHMRYSAPEIPFVSNVTGKWVTPEQAVDPDYWARHLRAPVRFW